MATDSKNENEPFFINNKGDIIICPTDDFLYVSGFSNDRAVISKCYKPDEKCRYGYMNLEGKIAIPAEYSRAEKFIGKYAYVEKDDKFMLIDENNLIHLILPARLDAYMMSNNPEDIIYILKNGEKYNSDGEKID